MRASKVCLVASILLVVVVACGGKTPPAAPPPPSASATPAPVMPEPAARPEPLPELDEYARIKAMDLDEIERAGLLDDVHFDYDRADISSEAAMVLRKNADVLRRFDFLEITLEGHCDERGTVEYNLALGDRRARATYEHLRDLGVPPARLRVVSYGKEAPACTVQNDECWRRNRRAHPTVTGKTL